MAKNNFVNHVGSDNSTFVSRVRQHRFQFTSLAENIAAGQVSVTKVLEAWMRSSGHKKNILGDYQFFGFAYRYNSNSNYKHYFTQLFANGNMENCS